MQADHETSASGPYSVFFVHFDQICIAFVFFRR